MNRSTLGMGIALGLGLGLVVALLALFSRGPFLSQAQGDDGYRTYYVAPGAECGTVSPCYATVQAAVDAADDPGDVIKVATGVYTDVNHRAGLAQVVYVSKTIAIQGGYSTTNWLEADPVACPTTLDARSEGRVLYITGPISITVDGLSLIGGNAAGLGGYVYRVPQGDVGGALYVNSANASIRNTVVSSSTAEWGGGGFLLRSEATISGNTFISNTATWVGGGLCSVESPAIIVGNALISNTASFGGGGLLEASLEGAQIQGNMIAGNEAAHGGGLYVEDSDALIDGNTLSANIAIEDGGGVLINGYLGVVSRNAIYDNAAPLGGGVCVYAGWPRMSGNTILSNTAATLGGGLYLRGTYPKFYGYHTYVDGNRFSANTANGTGGGVYLEQCDVTLRNNVIADNHGGGLTVGDGAVPRLLHTTLARNGDSGIAVFEGSSPALTNTILVSHTVGITVAAGSTATLEATLWGSGDWANALDWGGAGLVITGSLAGNLWGLPAFLDPDHGDYHITATSAALDAGVFAGIYADLDGEPRLGVPDLGADEYWIPGGFQRYYLPSVFRGAP